MSGYRISNSPNMTLTTIKRTIFDGLLLAESVQFANGSDFQDK